VVDPDQPQRKLEATEPTATSAYAQPLRGARFRSGHEISPATCSDQLIVKGCANFHLTQMTRLPSTSTPIVDGVWVRLCCNSDSSATTSQ
jgi:hypothetical protein